MFVPGVFTQSRNAFYGYATYIKPDEEEPVLQVKLGETDVSELPVLKESAGSEPMFNATGYTYGFQIVAGTVKAWKGRIKPGASRILTFEGATAREKLYGFTGSTDHLEITATNVKSITQGGTSTDYSSYTYIAPTIYS